MSPSLVLLLYIADIARPKKVRKTKVKETEDEEQE